MAGNELSRQTGPMGAQSGEFAEILQLQHQIELAAMGVERTVREWYRVLDRQRVLPQVTMVMTGIRPRDPSDDRTADEHRYRFTRELPVVLLEVDDKKPRVLGVGFTGNGIMNFYEWIEDPEFGRVLDLDTAQRLSAREIVYHGVDILHRFQAIAQEAELMPPTS